MSIKIRKPLTSFTVKLSKWRCGGAAAKKYDGTELYNREAKATKGYGDTALLNNNGFKCCLGFAVKQSGYRPPILNHCSPSDLNEVIPGLSRLVNNEIQDSAFTKAAIKINDTTTIPVETKKLKLIALGKKHGIEINFVP